MRETPRTLYHTLLQLTGLWVAFGIAAGQEGSGFPGESLVFIQYGAMYSATVRDSAVQLAPISGSTRKVAAFAATQSGKCLCIYDDARTESREPLSFMGFEVRFIGRPKLPAVHDRFALSPGGEMLAYVAS